MFINNSLDQFKIGPVNGSFSDSNGQHCHYIAKEKRRRQQKMDGDEKKFAVGERLETGRVVG